MVIHCRRNDQTQNHRDQKAANPNYATAHQRYSLYLTAMGRRSESLQEMSAPAPSTRSPSV
jgi:hypothetical protein